MKVKIINYKWLLITGVVTIALYFLGGWFQSIYGLDPPYFYVWFGFIMELVSYLTAFLFIIILILLIIKQLKNKHKTTIK